MVGISGRLASADFGAWKRGGPLITERGMIDLKRAHALLKEHTRSREDAVVVLDGPGDPLMHPGVLECASVGVPDDKSGEAVKVVVVKKDQNLTKEQVIEHCKQHLTGYKVPKLVEFRTELPKTPVGKILRRELRDKK